MMITISDADDDHNEVRSLSHFSAHLLHACFLHRPFLRPWCCSQQAGSCQRCTGWTCTAHPPDGSRTSKASWWGPGRTRRKGRGCSAPPALPCTCWWSAPQQSSPGNSQGWSCLEVFPPESNAAQGCLPKAPWSYQTQSAHETTTMLKLTWDIDR